MNEPKPRTDRQVGLIMALCNELGIDDAARHTLILDVTKSVESTKDLTLIQAGNVITRLENIRDAQKSDADMPFSDGEPVDEPEPEAAPESGPVYDGVSPFDPAGQYEPPPKPIQLPALIPESNSIAKYSADTLLKWDTVVANAILEKNARIRLIQALATEDDLTPIPGTKKPSLKKPLAEKINQAFKVFPDYELLANVENWADGFFFYRYKCTLRNMAQPEMAISTGIGSCNSKEPKYRYRKAGRSCPSCGAEDTIIKKKDFGKGKFVPGWLCYVKKGGCGAEFNEDDPDIMSQETGRVENEDIFELVNTIDKQAQKRGMIAATLNLGFGDIFTQDVEDLPSIQRQGSSQAVKNAQAQSASSPAPSGNLKLIEAQIAGTKTLSDLMKVWNEQVTKLSKPDQDIIRQVFSQRRQLLSGGANNEH